jgi:hypothetical protein
VTKTVTLTVTSTDTSVDGGTSDSCLTNWRATTCGEWCLRETQSDRQACRKYLDCYLSHACGPFSSCATSPDAACGVNRIGSGVAPKTIADQVYQCLGCAGSAPVKSCTGRPDTAPCTDNNACTKGDMCLAGACVPGAAITPCGV